MINRQALRKLALAIPKEMNSVESAGEFIARRLRAIGALHDELNSAVVLELLDRLDAAEKAVTEAYQRGYATGREEVEKERDQFKSDWLECLKLAEEAKPIIDRQRSEIDALRAELHVTREAAAYHAHQTSEVAGALALADEKIKNMERQEPVKHEFQGRDGTWHSFIDQRHYENTVADGTWPIRALYALPVTQPAPDVFRGLVDEIVKEADDYERRTGDRVVGWIEKARAALNAAPKPEASDVSQSNQL